MATLNDYSATAGSNTNSPPNGAPENWAPSTVNDTIRELMARSAKFYKDAAGSLTSTGSSNAYVLASNSTYTALADISILAFRANFENTGAATINVDSLGAKSIQIEPGVDLASGDIPADKVIMLVYNATDDYFEYTNPSKSAPTGAINGFPTSTIPNGWLECDGSSQDSVADTSLAALFTLIGTDYGGTGADDFNVPNYRGEFLRGHDGGSANDPDAATRTDRGDGTTGDNVGTKQAENTGPHLHAKGTLATSNENSHRHGTGDAGQDRFALTSSDTFVDVTLTGGGRGFTGGGTQDTQTETGPGEAHNHPITGSTANSTGSESRGRNVAVKWMIKI